MSAPTTTTTPAGTPRVGTLTRASWHTLPALPAATRAHAHAAAREAIAAARSLADGASDGAEAAIDHLSRLLGNRPTR